MISSVKNPKIKEVVLLQSKSKKRKEEGLFVFEGAKEFELVRNSDYTIVRVFYEETIISPETNKYINSLTCECLPVSKEVFSKIAYRESTGGIVVVAKSKSHDLDNLQLSDKALCLVLEDVEKPGNLGAVLRTADAAKVDVVFICNPKTDVYNPNVIRSSLGCLFTNKLIVCTSEQAIEFFDKQKVNIFSTYLHEGTINLYDADLSDRCALVLGTEATGISPIWVENAKACVKIPMLGMIDSLNISNAAAIVTYEALRQKKYIKS